MPERCSEISLPIYSARAGETVTRLNAVILSYLPRTCQASNPNPAAILRRLFHVLRWLVKEDKPAFS